MYKKKPSTLIWSTDAPTADARGTKSASMMPQATSWKEKNKEPREGLTFQVPQFNCSSKSSHCVAPLINIFPRPICLIRPVTTYHSSHQWSQTWTGWLVTNISLNNFSILDGSTTIDNRDRCFELAERVCGNWYYCMNGKIQLTVSTEGPQPTGLPNSYAPIQ